MSWNLSILAESVWTWLSTNSMVILTAVMAIVAFLTLFHKKKSKQRIKNQKEMDLLVRLLYSNIGEKSNIFLAKKPNPNSPLYQPCINFWDGIKQNQYRAGTKDFHSAINNYLEYLDNKNKTGRIYKEIRDELYKATEKRNKELEKLLK